MKRSLIFLLLLFFVILFVRFTQPQLTTNVVKKVTSINSWSPCDNPISYRIESVDDRFKMSKNEFSQYALQGAQLWNNAWTSPLFEERENGVIGINLVFDERQQLSEQINSLEAQAQNQEQGLKPVAQQYEQLSAEYEAKLRDFNQQVAFWNSQGGAPPDEYQRLKKVEDELRQDAQKLNDLARTYNFQANQYKSEVGTLNEAISTFNNQLKSTPEEGLYIPDQNRIEIYLASDKKELVHTLAHEFGHALDIGHVQDNKSIMYAQSGTTLSLTGQDKQELVTVCRSRGLFDKTNNNIPVFLYRINNLIQGGVK